MSPSTSSCSGAGVSASGSGSESGSSSGRARSDRVTMNCLVRAAFCRALGWAGIGTADSSRSSCFMNRIPPNGLSEFRASNSVGLNPTLTARIILRRYFPLMNSARGSSSSQMTSAMSCLPLTHVRLTMPRGGILCWCMSMNTGFFSKFFVSHPATSMMSPIRSSDSSEATKVIFPPSALLARTNRPEDL